MVMLQWQDESGWEHRAYWGADKFEMGTAGTASRMPMGPLPVSGQWVRLEVPTVRVDLVGHTLKGMAFTTYGGQCFWSKAGSVAPTQQEQEELVVVVRHPMTAPANENEFSGSFPLAGSGWYRIELRNELGHPNVTMQEARFVALPDQPPMIAMEKSASDTNATEITLSKPVKIPLVVSVSDDYGLADISLAFKRGTEAEFTRVVSKKYTTPQLDDHGVVVPLDLIAARCEAWRCLPLPRRGARPQGADGRYR